MSSLRRHARRGDESRAQERSCGFPSARSSERDVILWIYSQEVQNMVTRTVVGHWMGMRYDLSCGLGIAMFLRFWIYSQDGGLSILIPISVSRWLPKNCLYYIMPEWKRFISVNISSHGRAYYIYRVPTSFSSFYLNLWISIPWSLNP